MEFARLPEKIRGFGHVKEESVARVPAQWRELVEGLLHGAVADVADGEGRNPPDSVPVLRANGILVATETD